MRRRARMQGGNATGPSTGERRDYVALALVLGAVFVAFLPVLDGGFFWDDDSYVLQNFAIRGFSADSLRAILTEPLLGHYHPLTVFSLALDYRLGGLDALAYHRSNLVLHLACVALVWFFVRGLSGSGRAAWVAALLFGMHPLRVEPVAWISSRKDLLYAALLLGALVAYLRWTERGRRRFYAAALLLFVLAGLSKGMAVSLALLLPLVDFVKRRPVTRATILEKVPFFVLAAVFGAVALWAALGSGASAPDRDRTLLEKGLFSTVALVTYLGKTLWPANLSCFYPMPSYPPGQTPAALWLAVPAVLALAGAVAYSLRFTRAVAFGALFFLASLLFVLRPVGGAVLAERYTYVASVGLAYLAGLGYDRLRREGSGAPAWAARAALPVVVAAALALGTATWRRSETWTNATGLWNDVLAKHPDAWVAWQNRGLARAKAGDRKGALSDFDAAIRVRPEAAVTYNGRGNLKADLGDAEGAARDYAEAVRLDPGYAEAHYNGGYLDLERGDFDAAIASFDEALRLDPRLVQGWFNRGEALSRSGRLAEAVADYGRALAVDPGYGPALDARAKARYRLGDVPGAVEDARAALGLGFPVDPGFLRALRLR